MFLAKYQTTLYHAYGIVQKEYVTVPADLLRLCENAQTQAGQARTEVLTQTTTDPLPHKRGGGPHTWG